MSFTSHDAFCDFDRSVRRELRYVRSAAQEDFLKEVIATSKARTARLKAGDVLWRAQLGHDWRTEEQDGEEFEIPDAHPPKRMKPIHDKATDGRANPRGIPCLYLATKKDTAVLEVRPLIGSYVSVAQFKMMRDLRLVNCSVEEMGNLERWLRETPWTPEDIEKAVWSDINRAFSEPVERGDNSIEYVPTQIIAEAFKRHDFDGIAYKSSYGEDGLNVALFDIDAAELIKCGLYSIKKVSVKMKQENNPYFVTKHYEKTAKPDTTAPQSDGTKNTTDDTAVEQAETA
jgi:hypothetical protein